MPFRDSFKSNEEYNNYFRKYREKNREKLRAYNREYNRIWRKKNGYHNEENSKKRYPEKVYARRILNIAIAMGRIERGNCEICGEENAQGHHTDYFRPLEVQWLCPLHHTATHKIKKDYENKNN